VRKVEKRNVVLLLAALLTTSLINLVEVQGRGSVNIEGFVNGPNGEPLKNASLRLWRYEILRESRYDVWTEVFTDSRGHYELSVLTYWDDTLLYAFYDDPDTDGYDFLPSRKRLETEEEANLSVNFTLLPAATVRVTGELNPVESKRQITDYDFEVIDTLDGWVIELGEYRLIYGTGAMSQSTFLDLDTKTLIVPVDTPFSVNVSFKINLRDAGFPGLPEAPWEPIRIETVNEFSVVEGEGFILGAGEVMELDTRKYSLATDVARFGPMVEEVEVELSEVEGQGFYVAAESHDIQEAKASLSRIGEKIESQEYEAAYVDLRQAYMKLLSVKGRLEAAVYEAGVSLKILMVFTAVTSVALGALLAANSPLKLLLISGSFVSMILYLRQVFPGGAVIEVGSFASMAALSLLGALFVLSLLPRVLSDAVGKRGLSRAGALVAVFSMGTRSLKKRKLRSLFTFTLILILTMSFVALTSLSTSYGLIFNRYGNDRPDAEGIMVRMPYYSPKDEFGKGVFSPIIGVTTEWAWGNEGVVNVAELAENIPSLEPYGWIDEWEIFGVIGLQPDVEPLMPLIDDAVVEGGPLREEGDCLLHKYMRSNADLEVGDQITVGGVPMRIAGFFGNIGRIADMDGETIMPYYQILISPIPPTIELRVCNEDAVVITTLETALLIDRVIVSRIDVKLEPGADLELIGKSMALSREYRVWIAEGEQSHIAYIGRQIGGMGFPILVPWAIVILNVVTTMLNSMFERRREINILSSIGLNPMHIAGVFLAEASILGVTGGSIGYIMGLGLYPVMKNLAWAPIVNQKVSTLWLVASLGIAVTSVVLGSIVALAWSVGLTPSLTRRWNLGDQETGERTVWETRLPVRIADESLEEFLSYVIHYLEKFSSLDSIPRISSVKLVKEEDVRVMSFIYSEMGSSIHVKRTENIMTIARDEEGVYVTTMVSKGDRDAATTTGAFMRKIVIRWSTEQEKKVR
jgi:hypothetical protein